MLMASPQSSEKIASKIKLYAYDFDPDSGSATDVAWVDMQNFHKFGALVFRSVGTGTIQGFTLLANNASDGSGTDITIKSHALGSAPDAVGDFIFLECTAEEIAQEAADAGITGARYVSANIDLQTSTDECVVVYIFTDPRFAYDQLTADHIS
jgi:hypothetical protein